MPTYQIDVDFDDRCITERSTPERDDYSRGSTERRPYEPPDEDEMAPLTDEEVAGMLARRAELAAEGERIRREYGLEPEGTSERCCDEAACSKPALAETVGSASKVDPHKQLPYYSDHLVAFFNPLGRCALVSLRVSGRRRFDKPIAIAAQKGIVVFYEGYQLNQSDVDLLLRLFHEGRGRLAIMGADGVSVIQIKFRVREMLAKLGRAYGKLARQVLIESLKRLMSAVITIQISEVKQFTAQHLVTSMFRDERTKEYTVNVNARLLPLFAAGYARISWEKRKALRGQPLAQWLQMYLATHASFRPVPVAFIKQLCGSEAKDMREFRRSLRGAIKCLIAVGEIRDGDITKNDFLWVDRIPLAEQRPLPPLKKQEALAAPDDTSTANRSDGGAVAPS